MMFNTPMQPYGQTPMLPPLQQPIHTPIQPLPTANPSAPLWNNQAQFDAYNQKPYNDVQRQHYLLP